MNPVTEAAEVPTTRRLRADAARNQQRILTAARELFAIHGLDITLDLVAEHAGVGVGTVYRRFANKQELIEAALVDSLQQISEKAHEALRNPDPWDGLVEFFDSACRHMANNQGISEMLRLQEVVATSSITDQAREELEPVFNEVIKRAQTAGVLRDEVHPSDFFALLHMVGAIAAFARPVDPNAWHRYFEFTLDCLRADDRPRQPITTPPLSREQIDEAKIACGRLRRR